MTTTPTLPSEQREEGAIRILITEAGRENLLLRVLTQQAIPMLLHPEEFGEAQRSQLAEAMTLVLEGCFDEAYPDIESDDYEPGCALEEDPW